MPWKTSFNVASVRVWIRPEHHANKSQEHYRWSSTVKHERERESAKKGQLKRRQPLYTYSVPVQSRQVQFCTLLQVPIRLYGDSRNLNSFTASLHLQ
jgi:hypothetical protein